MKYYVCVCIFTLVCRKRCVFLCAKNKGLTLSKYTKKWCELTSLGKTKLQISMLLIIEKEIKFRVNSITLNLDNF